MIILSEDGYSIKGIAPPDLRDRPEFALAFWGWVTDLGLRAKDNELSRGLDRHGKPLKRITEATRLHRRSAMTPTGKGDPSAPPLMPGRQLSRTRSLLTGRAYPDHAAFWWRFDPWSGASWARTLEHQRDRWGRDVFGISPKAEAAVKLKAWGYWADLKAGRPIPVITARQAAPVVIPQIGRTPTAAAVFGIGAGGRTPGAEFSGGLTRKEWEAYFRGPAKVAIPGRPGDDYNVILRHIWGAPGGPAKAVAIIPKPPKPQPIQPKPVVQRVALPPKPPAPPPPPSPPKPALTAWRWGQPIAPDKPIAERIKLATSAREHVEQLAKIVSFRETQEALSQVGKDMMAAEFAARAATSPTEKTRLLATVETMRTKAKRLKATRESISANIGVESRAILTLPPGVRNFDWSVDGTGLTTDPSRKATKEAVEWMAKLAAEGAGKGHSTVSFQTIPASEPQRAYNRAWKNECWLSEEVPTRTAIHEWGHQLEASIPGVHEATVEFLKHRVGNEPLRKMSELNPEGHYKDTELGREDDFAKVFGKNAGYAGKDYPHATEIISMGIEELYADPGRFARKDPEFCTFIVGILDGSLRKP